MREKYAEAAEKTRAEQARMIESFERKKEERLESEYDKHVDLRLDLDHRSSSTSSGNQRKTRSISPDGVCHSRYRGRNRRIPDEERYRTPKPGHYTEEDEIYQSSSLSPSRSISPRVSPRSRPRDKHEGYHARHNLYIDPGLPSTPFVVPQSWVLHPS
jgi:hypothetical protein